MVECLSCGADGNGRLRFINIVKNRALQTGDKYKITVTYRSKAWIGSLYGRVCLFESGDRIGSTNSVKISAGQEYTSTFTGSMIDRDMVFKVSLQEEGLGFIELCMDAIDFTIVLSSVSEPPTDPSVTPPGEDAQDNDDNDGDDLSLIDYINDYFDEVIGENTTVLLVLGMAVILVIVIVRK